MRTVLIVVFTLIGVAALEACFYAYRFLRERRAVQLQRRLRSLGRGEHVESSLLRAGRFAKSPALDQALRQLPLLPRLERLLEQTDLTLTVAQLLLWSGLLALGTPLVALTLGARWPVALLALLISGAAPTLFVRLVSDRRSRRISEQLPDALDMMARSLKAGHALSSALQVLASELPSPIALEFGRAYEAQNLGLPLERSILQMCGRAPNNRDLRIFAVSVIVQKETGGNLAEILEKIAETIRARYRFYGKLRALTAEGRASGIVLGVLPLLMTAFLLVVNPHYLAPMFEVGLGRVILIYAGASWLAGALWLYRMTQLEF